jgi:glycosyltransferase involved in cell wall biosynthesis
MQKTCVIIPCFNEEHRLELDIFSEYIAQNPYHFCFVNDGSSDNTIKILNEIKERSPIQVTVLDLGANFGKAEAVRQGFLTALKTGEYTYIGYFDADLATPLDEINYLLDYFTKGYVLVMGSRVKRLGAEITRNPLRHYLGRIFATLASSVLKLKIYDSQCGAKFFQHEIAKTLFAAPFASKWLFDLELIYRFKSFDLAGFNRDIIEVPLRTWKEKKNSKMNFVDFMAAPFELFKIKNNTASKADSKF